MIVYVVLCTLIFLLIAFFVILPIQKIGFYSYVYYLKMTTPRITSRVISRLMFLKGRKDSHFWFSKIQRVNESEIPSLNWVEDSVTSKGLDSFYLLDNYADEVRPLSDWSLPYDPKIWWDAKFTNNYLFSPQDQPLPRYNFKIQNNKLSITTGDELDTWVYLVSKQKQPSVYSIEFDFTPHIESQETLQIDFHAKHLASRFRFDLEQNRRLRFDIIYKAQFLNAYNKSWRKKLEVPCELRLHQINHIQLKVINEIFAFYLDGVLQMAVRVSGITLTPMYWFLIFWNGTKKKEKLDFEIMNLKIYHAKD